MEGLLPSEIARLVLGYLQEEEEGCEEVAKSYLEKSPLLAECLKLSRLGRKFSTKVQGHSLTDILEEYCALHSIVQEQLSKLPPGNEQLKHASVVDQLKYVFGARCPVQVKITLNSQQNGQSASNGETASELATSTPRVRNTKKSVSRFQNSLDQSDLYPDHPPAELPPPNATPLESLPGNTEHAVTEINDGLGSSASHVNQRHENPPSSANFNEAGAYVDNASAANPSNDFNPVGEKPVSIFTPPSSHAPTDTHNGNPSPPANLPVPSGVLYSMPEQDVQYSSSYLPAPVELTEEPATCSDSSRTKQPGSSSKSKTVTTPGRKQPEEPAEAVDVLVLKRALLNNFELQARLADNINSVILNKDPATQTPAKQVPETTVPSVEQTLAAVTSALDEVIPTIVERTEADPVFERFLEEFFLFDSGKSNDATSATQENGSKSAKKKKKASAGKDADTSGQNISTDHFGVPAPVGFTPAKLEIEAAVAAASLNPMTPSTSKLIHSLTNPNATPTTDPKQPSSHASTSSTEPSPAEEDCQFTKKGTNNRRRKKGKLTKSTSKSPGQPPPAIVEKNIQRTNQILSAFIPIAPRPLTQTLHVTVSDGRISSSSKCDKRPWRSTYLNENILVTVNAEDVARANGASGIAPRNTTAIVNPNVNSPVNIGNVPAIIRNVSSNTEIISEATETNPTAPSDQCGVGNLRWPPPVAPAITAPAITAPAITAPAITAPAITAPAITAPAITAPSNAAQSTTAPSTSAPSTTAQESKKDKPAEGAPCRLTEGVHQQDISVVGRTPAFQPEMNNRRLSMSTPRRNSHIRALDFNTPPKDDAPPARKANTSPKIHKHLSPNSSKALAKLSAKRRGEIAKEEERNSRVKAHLFTSPEYAMTSSSGFKPSDNVSGEDMSGITAIKEPAAPTARRAWDADLRASVATAAPQRTKPKPAAKRKRKGSAATKSPEPEKSKVEPPEKKKKNDSMNLSAVNESTQSDHDLGKLLEQNIMNSSANSLNKSGADAEKRSSGVADHASLVEQSSIMSLNTTDDSREVDCSVGEAQTHHQTETTEDHAQKSEEVEPDVEGGGVESARGVAQEEVVCKQIEQSSQSLPNRTACPAKLATIPEEATNRPEETSLHIPIRSAANLSCMETPVKDYLLAVPPTPSIPSPNTIAQDTPITKILRVHMPTMTFTAASPTMPPTPSIKNTHEISPISAAAAAAAAYFKPSSPTRDAVRKAIMADDSMDTNMGECSSNDSLEGELIRECSRIEKKNPTPAKLSAKDDLNSSMESSSIGEDKSAESGAGHQDLDFSTREPENLSERLEPEGTIAREREEGVGDRRELETVSKHEMTSSHGNSSTTARTKSKKGSPLKIPNEKGAKNITKLKNPPRKPKPLQEIEVCSETMRAKLSAMQGNDIEEALNRLHGIAGDSSSRVPDAPPPVVVPPLLIIVPPPNTPLKRVPDLKEKSSATKSKTPGKSKLKTPLKRKTPLKVVSPGGTVGRSKKTPLKSKTSHKSAPQALDKLIDSAKKRSMLVDPNESTSSSSSRSSSSSSSSDSSSTDSDTDSSDSEEESPVKNSNVADGSIVQQPEDANVPVVQQAEDVHTSVVQPAEDVDVSVAQQAEDVDVSVAQQSEDVRASAVQQAEDADVSVVQQAEDSQPLKASTPRNLTKMQIKPSPTPRDDILLSPIHGKQTEEIATDVYVEKRGAGIQSQQAKKQTSKPSTISNEIIETSSAKDCSKEVVMNIPSRKATKPVLRGRGTAARKPIGDSQQKITSKLPSQDDNIQSATHVEIKKPDLSRNMKEDLKSNEDDVFVQKKPPSQKELIGTLQSKERVADKVMNKKSAEDLAEKKRRMILRLKNPPEKGAKKRPTKAEPVSQSEEVASLRRSTDDCSEESPPVKKPQGKRSKSANDAEQPQAKATDNRSKSEGSCAVKPAGEDLPEFHITSDEEQEDETPSAQISKVTGASRTCAKRTETTVSKPLKSKVVQEEQLRQVLGDRKAPPKKRIQKTVPGTAGNEFVMRSVVDHDSRSGDAESRRNRHTKAGSDLQALQHPLQEDSSEAAATTATRDMDSSLTLNKKDERVVYKGDTIPSPRKKTDVDLDNLVLVYNVMLDDGKEVAQTVSVTPLFNLFEMESASDRGKNGHVDGRVERERSSRSDRDKRDREIFSRKTKEDRYRKRPRSPSAEYHRRGRRSSRERDSRSSSDPRRHQSSSERSQKRIESVRSPENPRKKRKPGKESAEEGELISDDDAGVRERPRNNRDHLRRRWGDRDEWRRHACEERQRQNRRRKVSRSNDWSSDEGAVPSRRGRADNQGTKSNERGATRNPNKDVRIVDTAEKEKSLPTRSKEKAECTAARESAKLDGEKAGQSQHVALPPDVESGNSQQSNISTVAVASNSSPENKFASSRSGLTSGKVRTRGGRSGRGHVRTMGRTSRQENSESLKDSHIIDMNDAQRLRAGLDIEELLDRIHKGP